MNDNPQFLQGMAALRALRASPPPHIGEEHVAEYHCIVGKLEAASGHDLSAYRIAPSEMEQPITSFNPRTGHVQRSSVLRCPGDLFRRRIDGLHDFISTALPLLPLAASESTDYWAMTDAQLEQLAAKFHISPIGGAGGQGQHWYIDRHAIIDALVTRDQALRPPEPTANVMHIGSMVGSNVQQGTGAVVQVAHLPEPTPAERPWFRSIRNIIELVVGGLILAFLVYEIKLHV